MGKETNIPENSDNGPVYELDTENPNFDAEIAKSRAMLGDADKPAAEPAGSAGPRRRPGRPSKAEKEAEEAAKKAAQAAAMEQQMPKEGLKQLVALPFGLVAFQTGFNGFQLTNEEAEAIVPSMQTVLATYAPQMNGENIALVTFAGALFSVGLAKYMAYLEFRKLGGKSSEIQSNQDSTQSPQFPESEPIPVLRA